jgi:hypothetical protein
MKRTSILKQKLVEKSPIQILVQGSDTEQQSEEYLKLTSEKNLPL